MKLIPLVSVQRGIRGKDFGIAVEERDGETVLAVPAALYAFACDSCGLHTAGELIAAIDGMPSGFRAFLQWQSDELRAALFVLIGELRGHVDDHLLDLIVEGRPRQQFATGACTPVQLPDQSEECPELATIVRDMVFEADPLPEDLRRRFAEHLSVCANCSRSAFVKFCKLLSRPIIQRMRSGKSLRDAIGEVGCAYHGFPEKIRRAVLAGELLELLEARFPQLRASEGDPQMPEGDEDEPS